MLRLVDEYLDMKLAALRKFARRKTNPTRLYKGKGGEIVSRNSAFAKWVREVKGEGRLTRDSHSKTDKFIEMLRQVSALDRFFEIDAEDEFGGDLQLLFENGADLVICGHTHSAKAYRLGGGLYLNTGTWGQLLRLPMSYDGNETWLQFLEVLKSNRAASFRRPTFVHLKHIRNRHLTRASLFEWKEPQSNLLCAWSFIDQSRRWQQEA
jgi:hypothetical protein